MSDINIVELIEKNPITKLSDVYNNKLLNKIKETFTDFEQQLFVSSFYCYLNYDKNIDFVIDLDDVWKWLGFSQKIRAKECLEKYFKIDIDYKSAFSTEKALLKDNYVKQNGGQNIKKIFLTIRCFKSLCLKSQTKKASEIHDYYMKMEEVLHELIEEETDELRNQLQQKDQQFKQLQQLSKEDKQKAVEQTLINQFPVNTECVYFGKIDDTNENNEMLIKFGHTNNLYNRVLDHKKNYNNFILLEAFKVQNKVEIENCIKSHLKIKKQIRTIQINDKNKTEIIAYDNNSFTIDKLTKYIKKIIQEKNYSIESFNKLLHQNQDLLKENEELKLEISKQNEIITKQELEISELKEQYKTQEKQLEELKNEDKIIYKNPLLDENEQTDNFNQFIDTMCIVRADVEETSVNLEGAYRIWNKVKPTKETFHAFKHYLDSRFKPSRLTNQNKNQVVYGYVGVMLKVIEYKKKFVNNDVETFLFQNCRFIPSGKILNSTLLSEFQRWKQMMNKTLCDDDLKIIKNYLNSSEYVIKATVWTDLGSNEGYYGITLKNNEYKHKLTSSTGKKVEKIEYNSGQVLCVWETIAKAALAENISPTKMSRSIKNKTIFNNDYYYKTL
jgi:hypothetical protein